MHISGNVRMTDLDKWMDLDSVTELSGFEDRLNTCKIESFIQENVKMRDVKVVKAVLNTSGEFTAPNLFSNAGKNRPQTVYKDLPPFIDVEIAHKTGKYTETTWLWIPLKWNGRFMGTCGGGNRTSTWSNEQMARLSRAGSIVSPMRNGFASAVTDGGNREEEFFGWGVDKETGEVDLELYHNWIDYSTHNMTVLAKAAVEAITGEKPMFSYIIGSSGGGRQVLSIAQKYPMDYDGYWSDAPCVSYNRMLPALIWPAVVMNEYKNALPPIKFEAFRKAAWEKAGGKDNYYNMIEKVDLDPYELVGQMTDEGEITELDAKVMQLIFEGAQTKDGEFLWYGMRPGVESWSFGGYCAVRKSENSETGYEPVPFFITDEFIRAWMENDKEWDYRSLTIDGFEKLFRRCMAKFPDMDTENPDLRPLYDIGGKMIICHGIDDSLIYVDGSIAYYEKIIRLFGSKETVKEFVRLLVVPGDSHGSFSKNGAGPSIADAMCALMNWVEKGEAPDCIHGQRFDREKMCLAEEKYTPVY